MRVVKALRAWLVVAGAVVAPGVCGAWQPPVPSVVSGPGEVVLDVDAFGVGNAVRPGDWTGVRVRLTDSSPKARAVVLQVSVPDADADRVLMQREVTTNPGVTQATWVYMRLPSKFRSGEGLNASVFEAVEAAGAGETALRAGRLLGTNRLLSKTVYDQTTGMVAVMGPKPLGLQRYAVDSNTGNRTFPAFGHELSAVLAGLKPADLPDRWMGLAAFEVLVWGSENPGDVGTDRAEALKEWVRRGGHMVIVLPAVGENWTNPQATKLHDLLPSVSVNRREGVDLNDYRAVFTADAKLNLPKDGVVYEFTRAGGAPANDAEMVLSGAHGECVVARRLYGAGMVTVVGVDLTMRVLSDLEGLDPAVFWHRVLGRRGKLPTPTALAEMGKKNEVPYRSGEVDFDSEVAGQIAKSGRTAGAVLLGLVLFGVYWVIAGPLGFALLKRRGWVRHSWAGFFVAGAAFTGIAWGGATMLRERKVGATHLTMIDHVFGQPVDRARSWLSLMIPWYGQATVGVGEAKGPGATGAERAEFTNLIAPWDPPGDSGQVGSFPDARGYVVDTRSPSRMSIPTRATVKQVQVDWAGGPVWKMPFPVVGPDGAPEKLGASAKVGLGESWARGSLTHGLPGPLKHVTIVAVGPQLPLGQTLGARVVSSGRAVTLTEDWPPGEVLDLSGKTRVTSNNEDLRAEAWFKRLRTRNTVRDEVMGTNKKPAASASDAMERLIGAAFFSQLDPPDISEGTVLGSGAAIARRRLTHTMDLGRWMTHPCIIIVGVVGDETKGMVSPVPLTVDGEKLATEGLTIVRWVYPLPDEPPEYPKASEAEKDGAGASGPG